MDNNKLSIEIELIVNYLNNIININILLVTIGLVLIYWGRKNSSLKNEVCNCWNIFIFIAIIAGICMIIVNLFIYKDLITEFTKTGLNPDSPYIPNPLQNLSNLNIVFYLDLLILVFLLIGFLGKKHEKNTR